MKYLRIENGKVKYINRDNIENTIEQISKEDILYLFTKSIEDDDFEMDVCEDNLIQNKVHLIIYKEIYSKLNKLISQKAEIKKEINDLYKDAVEKYI